MSFLRWIPTFLAFPLGGLLAMLIIGPVSSPLAALGAGLLAGALIGAAQWLALGRLVDWRWPAGSAISVSVGMAIAVVVAGAPVTPGAGIGAGVITGLLLGAAQGALLARGVGIAAIWAGVVAVAWGVGWLVTSVVIVDIDRGHVVFGASGAIVATLITGAALRLIVGPRTHRRRTTDEVGARVGA